MGWSAGMSLLADVWEQVEHFVPTDERNDVAKNLIDQFLNHDADDYSYLDDNSVLRKALKEILGDDEDDAYDE